MNWYNIAKNKIGTKEIPGSKHNPEVIKMYADSGNAWVKDDETAWCAAFVGSVLKDAGYPNTGKLNAKSYLNYGKKIKNPKEGAIAVLWRGKPNSWQGHVGFVSRWTDRYVWLVGGNQNNMVNETRFPRNRVLGFRWPDETKRIVEITKTVRKNSTKLSLLQKLRNVGTFIFASIASVFSLDTLGTANDIATSLRGFMQENMILITLGGIAVYWLTMKWVEGKSVNDYINKRYTPSKMIKDEDNER